MVGRGFDKLLRLVLVGQQRFHFAAQRLIVATRVIEKCLALCTTTLQCRVIQLLNLLPAFRLQSFAPGSTRVAAKPLPVSNRASLCRAKPSAPRRFLLH